MSFKKFIALVILIIALYGCNSNVSVISPAANATFNHPTQLFGDSQNYIDQIEKLNREILSDPNNTELYMQRGLAYKFLIMMQMVSSMAPSPDAQFVSEWEAQAKSDFSYVIEHDSTNAQAYYERSMLLGTSQDKISDLTKAIENDNQNGEYYTYRALNYYDLKEYDRALQDFDKALQFTSDLSRQADIKFMRGKMYAEQGQLDLALSDYDAGLQVLPNYLQAVEEREEIVNRIRQNN